MHKEVLVGCVAITFWCQTDTIHNTAGISIDNKDWFVGSIQYYGISCLQPNAMDGEKLLAKQVNIISK